MATYTGPVYWYLARDMAVSAYLTLTISILLGLEISLIRVTGERMLWHIQDLHYTFATLTGVLMVGHMFTLTLDSYMPFSLANLFLPLNQPISPVTVDLGIISFYGILALLLSSWLRRMFAYSVWRIIHYVSFVTFVLVSIHGWLTGSDAVTPWMSGLFFGCELAVGVFGATHIFISLRPRKRHMPLATSALVIALLIGAIGMITLVMVRNATTAI